MKIREVWNSRIPKWLNVGAITIYPFVFYEFPGPDSTLHRSWERETRRHEWIHIDQIRSYGFFSFYLSYFVYYLAGLIRFHNGELAYMEIPFEIEARESAKQPRQEYV